MEGTGTGTGDDGREDDDDLDAWDGEDVPPSRPRPELPIEERKRRFALLERPEHKATLRRIVSKWLGKHGEEVVKEALDAAEVEALSDPGFPTDDNDLPKYVKRLASRVVKRFQRDRKDVKLNRKSLDDQPLAVQANFEGYDENAFADAARRRALKEARADAKNARAFTMLYDRYVRRKSVEQIAAEHQVEAKTVYTITDRLRKSIQSTAAGVMAIAILLFVVRHRDEPVAHHDEPTVVEPTPHDRALALTASAQKECDGAQWTACRALLDKAAFADPAIATQEAYKTLRAASDAVLGPSSIKTPDEPRPPTQDQAPDKGPTGPDKGPKGPKGP